MKLGVENPISVKNCVNRSNRLPFLTAQRMPSGIVIPSTATSVITPSRNVFLRCDGMTSITGLLYSYENPKFPSRMPET